jgi:hypothetical protein
MLLFFIHQSEEMRFVNNTAAVCLFALTAASLAHADSYDPATGRVTIDALRVGDTVYTNVVVTVASVLTVGGSRSAVPAGYVSQGGLIWSPVTSTNYNWTQANTYCTSSVLNGQSGWRLPTLFELSGLNSPISEGTRSVGGLYASGAFKGQGWTLSAVWSSTPASAGQDNVGGYNGVFLADNTDPKYPFKAGQAASGAIVDQAYVSCVHN